MGHPMFLGWPGESNGKGKGNGKGKQQILPLRCGMTNKNNKQMQRQPTLCDEAAKDGAPGGLKRRL